MPRDFATAEAAAERPSLSSVPVEQVGDLLHRASVIIRADCPGIDERVATSEDVAALVEMVCIDMAERALGSRVIPDGVTQMSQTAGPLTASWTKSSEAAAARLFLSRVERQRLMGRRGARAGGAWMIGCGE